MSDLLSFVFSVRFFHFLFVIGAISYLIKTRLNPLIDKDIVKQEEELNQLAATLGQLKNEKKDTVASIQQQQLHGKNLLDRITTWNGVVQKLKERDLLLQVQSQEALKEFTRKQQHALLMEHLKHEMVPCVMREAREILEKKFESTTAQETFLNRSLAAMEAEKQ